MNKDTLDISYELMVLAQEVEDHPKIFKLAVELHKKITKHQHDVEQLQQASARLMADFRDDKSNAMTDRTEEHLEQVEEAMELIDRYVNFHTDEEAPGHGCILKFIDKHLAPLRERLRVELDRAGRLEASIGSGSLGADQVHSDIHQLTLDCLNDIRETIYNELTVFVHGHDLGPELVEMSDKAVKTHTRATALLED